MTVQHFSQVLSLAFVLGGAALAHAATANEILGTWSPDNGKESKVEITQCGDRYCGAIIWMRMPRNDDRNVDPAQRKRPLVAARIMSGFKFEGGATWGGGKLYNSTSGKNFDSKIVMLNHKELAIHEGESKTPVIWRRIVE